MGADALMSVITCAGQLGLAVLAAVRASRTPLAIPLALLCLCLFGWNFMALAHDLSGEMAWRWIDVSISPLTMPIVLHFVLVFVGESRRYRTVLRVAYAAFGALSVASLAAFVSESAREFSGSESWALVHLLLVAPAIVFVLFLLVRHLRRGPTSEERARTRLVLAAFAVGAAFGPTELLADAGVDVLRLGNAGTFASALLLAVVSLRFRLLDERPSWIAGLAALCVGAIAVLGYMAVFSLLKANEAMLILGTASITVVLVVALRPIVTSVAEHRARQQRLAVLGRLSAQMAHDLKTPVAALKGAAQFLLEERAQGRSIDDQGEFLTLLVEESDRLARLVDKYRRLGTLEPQREERPVNELIESVLEPVKVTLDDGVKLHTELGADLPPCDIDEDLLVVALENVLGNAVEAMPDGGALTVRTEPGLDGGVAICVTDTGVGMDPRNRERAFDEFHTTKATGTGLGLSFVRRVVEAHGGTVALASEEGRGTEVRLYIPRS